MPRVSRILAFGAALIVLTLIAALTYPPHTAVAKDTVFVENTPLPVRDVDNPARIAFQKLLTVGFSGSQPSFTVPATSHLVIEFVTMQCGNSGSTSMTNVGLRTSVSGESVGHVLTPMKILEESGTTYYSGQASTRIYADPGTTVSAFYSAPSGAVSVNCGITVSGFLAPAL